MAFPKTSSGSDLMLDAPSPAEAGQLAELGLALLERPRERSAGQSGSSAMPAPQSGSSAAAAPQSGGGPATGAAGPT